MPKGLCGEGDPGNLSQALPLMLGERSALLLLAEVLVLLIWRYDRLRHR